MSKPKTDCTAAGCVFLNSEIRKKDGITDIKYPISLTQGYKIKGNMRDHVLLFYKK